MKTGDLIAQLYHPCPAGCEHKFRVDYLDIDGPARLTAGPWYCDECGAAFDIVYGKGEVDFVATDKRTEHQAILLKIPAFKPGPIYFLVRGMKFFPNDESADEPYDDRHRYFYEEHTCPTNWLSDVSVMSYGGDADPHGVAEFVASAPWPASSVEDDQSGRNKQEDLLREMIANAEGQH